MPSFMLQPVVENAYSHGLKSREEGGRILLRAWMQGKVLVLTVADNGKGMAPEELDAVQAKLPRASRPAAASALATFPAASGCCIRAVKCRCTAVQVMALWCGLNCRKRSSRKKRRRRSREVQIAGGRG